MSEAIFIVGRSTIHEGKLEEVKAVMDKAVEVIKAKEPRSIFYNAYINKEGTQLTVLQAYPDAESLAVHMQVAGDPAITKTWDYVDLTRVDIYGTLPQDLLDKTMQASYATNTEIVTHDLSVGFSRF